MLRPFLPLLALALWLALANRAHAATPADLLSGKATLGITGIRQPGGLGIALSDGSASPHPDL